MAAALPLALVAAAAAIAASRGAGSHARGGWSRPVRLLDSGRYTFAPVLAVSEDGQMIAAWFARAHPPRICACGEARARRSTPAHHAGRRQAPPKPTGTKVIVDPGSLPGGFERPIVVSHDGTDVEGQLKVAVSGSHVAYVAFDDAHYGWRIRALRGGHLSKPVGLPHGTHGGSHLVALLSSREGPVTAVWVRFGAHDDWSWNYAHLHADGTLGPTVRIARLRNGDSEARFAVNDNGALAAAWVQASSTPHSHPGSPPSRPHATAIVVRCSVRGACSAPTPVPLGAAEPEYEEVALALSDDGRITVLASGHDRGSVEPAPRGGHLAYTPGTDFGVWSTSAAAGAKLGSPSQISAVGASPVTSADGVAGAMAAFQLREPAAPHQPVKMPLGLSLLRRGQSTFGRAIVVAHSYAPGSPALTANLAGQSLAAWKQPTAGGRGKLTPIEVLIGHGTHLGVARRLPGTGQSGGATPAAGIDSVGDAIVLWGRSCKGARTCGMYASILQARPSRQRTGMGTLTGAIRFVGGPAPAPGAKRSPSAGWVHVQTPAGKTVRAIHVEAGHRFDLSLPAGRYRVYGTGTRNRNVEPGSGCGAHEVHVRPGHATNVRLAIGCLVP